MNTFIPVSCVVSYTFGNGILCFGMVRRFENALVSPIKAKFGRERCAFFTFAYFCEGCVHLKTNIFVPS